MSVVERLEQYMNENGYKKTDVARMSGIPYTTIDGLFKKGDENTKLSTLKKLAKLIGCSLDELTGSNNDYGYYSNPETAALAQQIHDNPDLRILMDASKDLAPEDVKFVADLVSRMKKKESGFIE
jgi:transcriptional regulator with XRE-family HTH domain